MQKRQQHLPLTYWPQGQDPLGAEWVRLVGAPVHSYPSFGDANIAAMDRNEIKSAYAATHPSESKRKVAASAGHSYCFAR